MCQIYGFTAHCTEDPEELDYKVEAVVFICGPYFYAFRFLIMQPIRTIGDKLASHFINESIAVQRYVVEEICQ